MCATKRVGGWMKQSAVEVPMLLIIAPTLGTLIYTHTWEHEQSNIAGAKTSVKWDVCWGICVGYQNYHDSSVFSFALLLYIMLHGEVLN